MPRLVSILVTTHKSVVGCATRIVCKTICEEMAAMGYARIADAKNGLVTT